MPNLCSLQAAFVSPQHHLIRPASWSQELRRRWISPQCRKESPRGSSNRKNKRTKRPRQASEPSEAPGFGPTEAAPNPQPSRSRTEQSELVDSVPRPDLQKRDASGISMEDRLREEIAHPLRKPKQTLFGTLSFSALLGLFFALARSNKDTALHVAQNVAVDIAAIALFAWLTWREVQFGRRSLNSLAGRPQARDLQVLMLGQDGKAVGNGKEKMVGDLGRVDVVVAVGRAADLRKYLIRFEESRDDRPNMEKVIVFPTDVQSNEERFYSGADAVASGETEKVKDWVAWLGDAIPPRRNVALFCIEAGDSRAGAASSYVVAVGDPSDIPLPANAKRELSTA